MANAKVVFLHGLKKPILEWVMSHLPEDFAVTALSGKRPEPEIGEALRDADFLMVYRAKIPDQVLRESKNVRFVQLLAAGYDDMNLPLMKALNIPLAQNAGANSWAVADYAVMLMLAVYRRIVFADRATRDGRWRQPITGLNTFEMDGKLVGVCGMGNIGSKVTKRVQGFGARVQYTDMFPLKPEREQELGVTRVSFEELFRTSDIITLHAPLTPETNKMVNATLLATMKPTAVLINTSRGEVIDEAALLAALQNGTISGAGLDVFTKEPVDPANPLFQLENVVVSPHSAGTTLDTWQRRLDFAFGNMRRVSAGESPMGLVKV